MWNHNHATLSLNKYVKCQTLSTIVFLLLNKSSTPINSCKGTTITKSESSVLSFKGYNWNLHKDHSLLQI